MIIRTTIYPDQKELKRDGIISQVFEDDNHMNAQEIVDVLGYFTEHGPTMLSDKKIGEQVRAALASEDYEQFYEILRQTCKALRDECRGKSPKTARPRHKYAKPSELYDGHRT